MKSTKLKKISLLVESDICVLPSDGGVVTKMNINMTWPLLTS
jgi:hypothetical protein